MMASFAQRLIAWQHTHGRHDLPWQFASAYHVWLSEIMLQQTQVATVIPYYQRFIAAFPTLAALAVASEEQVLTHWSGLGYYARGRNLHAAAQLIAEKYYGEFPRKFEQILELPGVGRSTAAAICALAWHEHRAILDGNVKRVLARYCGIEGWAGDKKVAMKLWQQAENLLPLVSREITSDLAGDFRQPSRMASSSIRGGFENGIARYIQAQMDLGATLCTRSKPKCDDCPVQSDCVAFQSGRVSELPTPRPRKAVPERHTTFLLLMHGSDILLEKRPPQGIWGGLWSLPQFDDEEAAKNWYVQNGMNASHGERLSTFTHTFTHFKLHIKPLQIQLVRKPSVAAQPETVWLNMDDALSAAIPTPVRKMLKSVTGVVRRQSRGGDPAANYIPTVNLPSA
jgi:A/G-specific adenine glycosylase